MTTHTQIAPIDPLSAFTVQPSTDASTTGGRARSASAPPFPSTADATGYPERESDSAGTAGANGSLTGPSPAANQASASGPELQPKVTNLKEVLATLSDLELLVTQGVRVTNRYWKEARFPTVNIPDPYADMDWAFEDEESVQVQPEAAPQSPPQQTPVEWQLPEALESLLSPGH